MISKIYSLDGSKPDCTKAGEEIEQSAIYTDIGINTLLRFEMMASLNGSGAKTQIEISHLMSSCRPSRFDQNWIKTS